MMPGPCESGTGSQGRPGAFQRGTITPMTTEQIVTLVLTGAGFIGIGLYALLVGRRLRWPDGRKLKRRTSQGAMVTIIDAPGDSPGERARVGDACMRAVQTTFEVWSDLRPSDDPAEEFPEFAVWFVDDMDERQKMFPGSASDQSTKAYLDRVSRKLGSDSVPMAIIRDTLGPLVVKEGRPVIHECIHALLGEFSSEGVDRDHSDRAWRTEALTAESTFSQETDSSEAAARR